MAASQGPVVVTTVSRCTPNVDRGRHLFEVAGHSLHKSLGVGYIQSAAFSVGGHDWSVIYYPDGAATAGSEDYVSVYLQLLGKTTAVTTQVRATYVFRLLFPPFPATIGPTISPPSSQLPLNCVTADFSEVNSSWGLPKFVHKSMLIGFLWDDRLVIECDVTVLIGKPALGPHQIQGRRCKITMPPSDLSENLGKLLETGEGTDVTIKIEEEIFHAHKILLGIRSPVFKAELYGLLGDQKDRKHITIQDMQPAIFKALLYFIYTDTLNFPDVSNLDGDEREEMAKHLLVAADRYGVDRLKVFCEGFLERKLDVKTVATTLALADQYHCIKLRDSCIEFINFLNRTKDLQASQGYAHLKRACPDVFVDIWEKGTKSRKT